MILHMRKIDILHIVYHIGIDTCLNTTKAPILICTPFTGQPVKGVFS